ncbi:MAG TPA: hypothetical protein VM734_34005 [Kofleriaceae bacterium]|nr:hypothetical protein [Kofleriaceae bacterium]
MKTTRVLAVLAALTLGACGGPQVPQHSGYKGKKPRPWEKAKAIKLDEKFAGKVSADLDYAGYKRARWYYVETPGPGTLTFDLEVVPAGGSDQGDDEEGEDMDVAIELLDPAFAVIAKSDLESDDAHSLKKQLKQASLKQGKYLVHLYLQGRLDAAEVDLKVQFERGDEIWESDFPNQVAFVPDLAAVPIFDDSPAKTPPKPPKPPGGGTKPTPPKPPVEPPKGGTAKVAITDMQPDGSGVRLVIGAGTSAGLANGMKGQVLGVRGAGFVLSGCGPDACKATVKVSLDDMQSASAVTVKLQ